VKSEENLALRRLNNDFLMAGDHTAVAFGKTSYINKNKCSKNILIGG
jgi:hypothetical protein